MLFTTKEELDRALQTVRSDFGIAEWMTIIEEESEELDRLEQKARGEPSPINRFAYQNARMQYWKMLDELKALRRLAAMQERWLRDRLSKVTQ